MLNAVIHIMLMHLIVEGRVAYNLSQSSVPFTAVHDFRCPAGYGDFLECPFAAGTTSCPGPRAAGVMCGTSFLFTSYNMVLFIHE